MKKQLICPSCQSAIEIYRNPVPTVDIVIEINNQIVLINRKNKPFGWALPGGFIDYEESAEHAAVREAKEETCLEIKIIHLLGVYSDPDRDPRLHTISTVFVANGNGIPRAEDDAKEIALFSEETIPQNLAFDHRKILKDYFFWKKVSEDCGKHQ
jgi:ADP-ribose pyrophosphatase YjhB (NUDIX family)